MEEFITQKVLEMLSTTSSKTGKFYSLTLLSHNKISLTISLHSHFFNFVNLPSFHFQPMLRKFHLYLKQYQWSEFFQLETFLQAHELLCFNHFNYGQEFPFFAKHQPFLLLSPHRIKTNNILIKYTKYQDIYIFVIIVLSFCII